MREYKNNHLANRNDKDVTDLVKTGAMDELKHNRSLNIAIISPNSYNC
jgi:hypothetical protein